MRIWSRRSLHSNSEMESVSIPLRVIQVISGHNDLGTLQRYLEVSLLAEASCCCRELGFNWFCSLSHVSNGRPVTSHILLE